MPTIVIVVYLLFSVGMAGAGDSGQRLIADVETRLKAGRLVDALKAVHSAPPDAVDDVVAWTRANVQRLHAPFLFNLSRLLLARDRGEALDWYFRAWLWGVYDVLRCTDHTARQGVALVAGDIAQEVAVAAGEHSDEIASALAKAMDWETKNPSPASPMWICVHGIAAVSAGLQGKPLPPDQAIIPNSEWPKARTEARDYVRSLAGAIEKDAQQTRQRETEAATSLAGSKFRLHHAPSSVSPRPLAMVWLDNSRVLFVGVETPTQPPAAASDEKAKQEGPRLFAWRLDGQTARVGDFPVYLGHRYCVAGDYLLIDVYRQDTAGVSTRVAKVGPKGEQTLREEFPLPKRAGQPSDKMFNPYSCRTENRPDAATGHEWLPLRDGDAYLEWHAGDAPIRFRRRSQPMSTVDLPFNGRQTSFFFTLPPRNIVYYSFRQAYFIWDSSVTSEQWKRENCAKAWWLFPDGRTENLCVPLVGRGDPLGMDIVPTRAGLIVMQKAYRGRERGGLYLVNGENSEAILTGWIHTDTGGLGVSPDGCKIAFAYAATEVSFGDNDRGRLTAKALDFCSRATER